MSKFKKFKQKVKDNKGKIITGVLFIGGVAYIVAKQKQISKEIDKTLEILERSDARQTKAIGKICNVMTDTVLPFMLEENAKEIRNTLEEVIGENLDDMTDEEVITLARELVK